MALPTDRDILPDTIKPLNYDLSLFNLEFGGNWSYDGLVKIESKVKSDTKELVINSKELEITGAEVLSKDGGCMLFLPPIFPEYLILNIPGICSYHYLDDPCFPRQQQRTSDDQVLGEHPGR